MGLFNTVRIVFCAAIILVSGFLYAADNSDIKRITVAGITDKPPYEFDLTSETSGAYIEIWKLWGEKTGVEINYIIISPEKAEKSLANGDVDVIMGYPLSTGSADHFIIIPDIYILEIYIYRSKKLPPVEQFRDLQPFRTGITVSDAVRLGELSHDISFFIKRSITELMESCYTGEINVFLAEGARANYLLSRSGKWGNFIQSSDPVFSYGISAALKRGNQSLAEMISSGFSRVTGEERHIIEKTWSGGDFKYRIPWGYIGTITVILIIIGGVAVIWWWNFQLQRKVDSATEELKLMKEEAEAANLAKSRFLDNISHELRTPLTLILSPVEDAINGRPLCRENLEMIQRNSRNLLSLINDLLDLSRITAGKMKLNVSETDLGRALKLYCAEMESVAEYNGLSLYCSIPEEPVMAYIDRAKFSGIISNFFSNSLKFTGEGGRIDISLQKSSDEIHLKFTDNGPGIPSDKINTIFDRFSQAEATVSRQHEGTGIGLSIVKEIAELHGGSVSVRSRYVKDYPDDHLTEFTVSIPAGAEHLHGRGDVLFAEETSDSNNLPFMRGIIKTGAVHSAVLKDDSTAGEDKPSILVVEDNTDMRFFLKGLLEENYTVYTASDGAEALQILEKGEPADLILSDMMMPVMDGNELLSRLEQNEKYRDIPVIFLTARSDDLVKHRGLELGAVDYVIKPFNPDELLLRVKNQIQLSVMRNNLRRKNDELYTKLKLKVQSDVKKSAVTDEIKSRIDSVCSFIKENFRNDINRDLIAATIGMNPDIFSRNFNQHTGHTLPDYINSLRIDDAKMLLRETDRTVSRVAIETGFENLRTFNRVFRKFTG